jgi:hypothetical protein
MYALTRLNEREYRRDNKDVFDRTTRTCCAGNVEWHYRTEKQKLRVGLRFLNGEANAAGKTSNGEGRGKWSKEERKAHHIPLLLFSNLALRVE